jgi:hypothetical protein
MPWEVAATTSEHMPEKETVYPSKTTRLEKELI